jgi:hypothetical protein
MAEERLQRRLAAVLAADVAGYSRLMGTNELGTLNALKAHRREIIDPAISDHNGRIVKTTGDGILVQCIRCCYLRDGHSGRVGHPERDLQFTRHVPYRDQRRRYHHRWRRHLWRRCKCRGPGRG